MLSSREYDGLLASYREILNHFRRGATALASLSRSTEKAGDGFSFRVAQLYDQVDEAVISLMQFVDFFESSAEIEKPYNGKNWR